MNQAYSEVILFLNRRMTFGASFLLAAAIAGGASHANAAVLIRSFHFKICLTDKAHSEACRGSQADVTTLIDSGMLETLQSQVGQGATIEAVVPRGYAPMDTTKSRRHGEKPPQ
jgi:hypothetical protein